VIASKTAIGTGQVPIHTVRLVFLENGWFNQDAVWPVWDSGSGEPRNQIPHAKWQILGSNGLVQYNT